MDYGLDGKRALVLGASQGLGAASAVLLAGEGVHVTAASRSGRVPGAGIESATVDLSDPASVEDMCARLADEPVDILVNNSGGPKAGPARGQDKAAWQSAFETMAASLFALTEAATPAMIERGWGRVVTIGSSGIVQPIPGLALSNAIRGAIAGWSKTLADELAPTGVTVNMVIPGRIATDRLNRLDALKAEKSGQTVEEIETASKKTIPMGRYGTPEEFGAAVAFLCSTQASYITGSIIRADGGLVRSVS